MGLNVTNVFIRRACDALADNMSNLKDKDREALCDKLIKLCEKYAPGTFSKAETPEDTPKTREDINSMSAKYPKHWNETFNGVSFPFTAFEDGIIVCDYPTYNPEMANKITEEGRIQLNKLIEATKDIVKNNDK